MSRLRDFFSRLFESKRKLREYNAQIYNAMESVANSYDAMIGLTKHLLYKYGNENDSYRVYLTKELMEDSLKVSPVEGVIGIFVDKDGGVQLYLKKEEKNAG